MNPLLKQLYIVGVILQLIVGKNMELAITIVVAFAVSIAMGILWVNGIDYMYKNYPDYKGEDLFDEDKK